MQWPYKPWGADLVMSGHVHNYERLIEDGLTYIVSGLGGLSASVGYPTGTGIPGSLALQRARGSVAIDVFVDANSRRILFRGVAWREAHRQLHDRS